MSRSDLSRASLDVDESPTQAQANLVMRRELARVSGESFEDWSRSSAGAEYLRWESRAEEWLAVVELRERLWRDAQDADAGALLSAAETSALRRPGLRSADIVRLLLVFSAVLIPTLAGLLLLLPEDPPDSTALTARFLVWIGLLATGILFFVSLSIMLSGPHRRSVRETLHADQRRAEVRIDALQVLAAAGAHQDQGRVRIRTPWSPDDVCGAAQRYRDTMLGVRSRRMRATALPELMRLRVVPTRLPRTEKMNALLDMWDEEPGGAGSGRASRSSR